MRGNPRSSGPWVWHWSVARIFNPPSTAFWWIQISKHSHPRKVSDPTTPSFWPPCTEKKSIGKLGGWELGRRNIQHRRGLWRASTHWGRGAWSREYQSLGRSRRNLDTKYGNLRLGNSASSNQSGLKEKAWVCVIITNKSVDALEEFCKPLPEGLWLNCSKFRDCTTVAQKRWLKFTFCTIHLCTCMSLSNIWAFYKGALWRIQEHMLPSKGWNCLNNVTNLAHRTDHRMAQYEGPELKHIEPNLLLGEKELIAEFLQDETCCQGNERKTSAWYVAPWTSSIIYLFFHNQATRGSTDFTEESLWTFNSCLQLGWRGKWVLSGQECQRYRHQTGPHNYISRIKQWSIMGLQAAHQRSEDQSYSNLQRSASWLPGFIHFWSILGSCSFTTWRAKSIWNE